MILAYACAVLIWLSMITYTALGGADFGGGIWDLFSLGPEQEDKRQLIVHALGPVWEANNVWLIYLIVGVFTAFPVVAATLAITLFIPFSLALIGVVFRGASFAFRTHFLNSAVPKEIWGRVFGIASLLTPFLLGASAAAVASGKIHLFHHEQPPIALFSVWLTPFAIVIGLMGLALCATIAPVYLTVEASKIHNQHLARTFRTRAFIGGSFVAVLGIAGLALSPSEAPILWHGMLSHAIWAVVVTILLGIATGVALLFERYQLARIGMVLSAAGLLGTWGLSQLPYIIPPDLTIMGAASPPGTLRAFFPSALIGMLVLIPSLWFLFYVFKSQPTEPPVHEKEVKGV